MALTLNFSAYQSDDGKSIVFHETTGGVSSTTGWGYGANPATTDIVSTSLTIEEIDGEILTTGTGATFTVTQVGGALSTITIVSGGLGYFAGQVLDIIQSGGSNGTATITTVSSTGVITAIGITAGGAGYSNAAATGNCPIDISSLFPDDTDDTQWDFQMDDVRDSDGTLGTAGDIFPDGVYKLTYTVYTTLAVSYTKVKYIFCDYYIRCCIRKMFNALPISDCSCDDEAVCKAIKTRLYWKAIHAAVETGDYTRAGSLYDLVYNLCVNSGHCSGC